MQQNLEVDKWQPIGGTAYLNCICNFSNIFVTFVVCIVLYWITSHQSFLYFLHLYTYYNLCYLCIL